MFRYILSFVIIATVLFGQFSWIHEAYVMSPAYDFIMHIMGGVGVALLTSAILQPSSISSRGKAFIIIASALVAGLVWEFLELYFGITGREPWSTAYFIDTSKDLINDMIGGMIVVLFNRRS